MTRSFSLLAEIAADRPLAKVEPMSAPAIRGLAATIRNATASLGASAAKLSEMVQAEADGFAQDVQDVTAQVSDMKSARADLRAALGLTSNGAPPLDDATANPTPAASPPSSPTSAPSSPSSSVAAQAGAAAVAAALATPPAPPAPPSPNIDRRAIGPIVR